MRGLLAVYVKVEVKQVWSKIYGCSCDKGPIERQDGARWHKAGGLMDDSK
jgi:hypothetical protein